ncbi:MAG: biotin synthase [Sulfurospirillaceae bacterium]|nr:biotin synthase [Sulfurospirillaceae bacterium]
MSKAIFLCSICNVSSGSCSEDCGFCTQSAHHNVDINKYTYKMIEQIVQEAKKASENGAIGFCLVTSGKGLDSKKLTYICDAAKAVRSELPNIHLIACNGIATVEQLCEIKEAGVNSYNHNLESSHSFYKKLCSTHSWEERYQTCLNIKEAGLFLCSGGIFGLGESREDRRDFLECLQALQPQTMPINFYHPNPALPIKAAPLSEEEALEIIIETKKMLPNTTLMIAGGREITFKKNPMAIFEAGADAIVLGDYLTTQGELPKKDLQMILSSGYTIATSCHQQE